MDEINNPSLNEINNPSLIKNVFGETLFKNNCAQCHNANASMLVGPGLAGIKERRDEEWLIKWIQNPQKVIQSGDKYAIKLFEKFNKTEMTAFTNFKEEEILAILEYIDEYNQSQKAIP
ncbi:cytochrome c [Lacihabitans soyangensis]|uniref:Cytochrome c n=2 Tax=Lacihabitans soyangensis TaxID=869394 RepID=A0AAE3H2P9_9BACT|nr:cytochrome c [Lacihabitans soyangensis]